MEIEEKIFGCKNFEMYLYEYSSLSEVQIRRKCMDFKTFYSTFQKLSETPSSIGCVLWTNYTLSISCAERSIAVTFFILLLLDFPFYTYQKQIETQRPTGRFFIFWFTPQVPSTARTGPE